MKNVHVRHSPLSAPVVSIDGEDISSQLAALQLTLGDGLEPRLLIEGKPGGFQFDGDAQVDVLDPERDKRAIVEFLESIEPHWLEETILDGNSMNDGIGSSVLRALAKRAQDGA